LVPLDLAILLGGYNDHRPNEDAIVQLFSPHWLRCRSLTLSFHQWYKSISSRLLPFSNPMPYLQHLDFGLYEPLRDEEGNVERVVMPLGNLPRLCSLSVSVFRTGISITFGESIAPSLTSVTISVRGFGTSELSRLLAVCPALRSLTWEYPHLSAPEGPQIILPPSVLELKLTGGSTVHVSKLRGRSVQSLIIKPNGSYIGPMRPSAEAFPNIRKLHIGYSNAFPSFSTFARQPRLEELELEVRNLALDDINALFRACCNLRLLTVSGWCSDSERWEHAKDVVAALLNWYKPSLKIFFRCRDPNHSWSEDIEDLSRLYPDRFFTFVGL